MIHEKLTIEKGMITTVHNITGTQSLVDMVNEKKKDLRRARSGMLNLAPTSTGSATAVAEVFPELKGKLNGHAVRIHSPAPSPESQDRAGAASRGCA